MSDVFTKAKRGEVMSRIRSRGNRDTELALLGLLRRGGITGWRRHLEIAVKIHRRRARFVAQESQGKRVSFKVRPDFVFSKLRVALFVDGCFWHGCPRHGARPRTNAAFWRKKLAANRKRDRLVSQTLRQAGWLVVRLWEHELKGASVSRAIQRMRRAGLTGPGPKGANKTSES